MKPRLDHMTADQVLRSIESRINTVGTFTEDDAVAFSLLIREYGALMAARGPSRAPYSQYDVLSPEEVRAALGPISDTKWDDVKARIPWSDAVGPRMLRIQWGRLLEWLGEWERAVVQPRHVGR